MNMPTTWILAADASRARVFEQTSARGDLREVETFEHPEGRAHNRDLVTDGHGRYFGRGEREQGHTAPPRESAVEHENELFAKRLAEHLRLARTQSRFDRLRLVAAPKFLGLLRQNLDKEVDRVVVEAIAKDVAWFDPHSLAQYLKDKAA
jgi:protein required for attachment to host cells